MFEEIGKIFGTRALQVVIGVTAFYYALIAFARVREVYFGGAAARCAKARKAHLEMLKLEAEIAACRKTAGLEPLNQEQIKLPAAPARLAPLTRAANFLWSKGSIAQALLIFLSSVFQLFGWLAMGLLVLATRYWIIMRLRNPSFQAKPIEMYVLIAALLLGSGMLYLGFSAIGNILKNAFPRMYRVLWSVILGLAMSFLILFWISQNKELYPTGGWR